jgi:hypothetical protein
MAPSAACWLTLLASLLLSALSLLETVPAVHRF